MLHRLKHFQKAFRTSFEFDNPWQIIFAHLFYPKGKILYVWKGRTILVDGKRRETAGGIRSVLASTEYTQFFHHLKAEQVRNVLDLGANVGSFTVLAERSFPALKRVVVVEGDSTIMPRLEFNVKDALPEADVTILHRAVCDHDGEIEFIQAETSVGSGIASGADDGSGKRIVVKAISLARLLECFPGSEKIDFCKMDIEGSEYAAIYALNPAELARIRFIVTELHGSDADNERFIGYLGNQGFKHIPSDEFGNPSTHGFLKAADD